MDDDVQDARQYFIPAWDCPACGAVQLGEGQDDLTGGQTCDECDEPVVVIDG